MEPRKKLAIDIAVPSCRCCATRMESELSTVLGISKGAMRLAVPVKAQLRYDAHAVNLGMVVDGLRAIGCEVVTENAVFMIPARPALPPPVWTEKIKALTESMQGIVSASVSFQASRITVDYIPTLISLKEIREAVVGWGSHYSSGRTKDANADETADIEPMFNFLGRRAA